MICFVAQRRGRGDCRAGGLAAAPGACVVAFVSAFSYSLTLSPLHAQSGFSTLPYCAQYSDGTSLDCSFSTLSQCYQSVSGVGGVCINNPTATASAGNPQRPFGSPYAFAPSSVPPPPAQQSQGPLQLPGPQPQQAQATPPSGAPPQPQPPCNPLYNGTLLCIGVEQLFRFDQQPLQRSCWASSAAGDFRHLYFQR